MSEARARMEDAARLAMLDALTRNRGLSGGAYRAAFGGLDAALRAVFKIMDEQDAATRAALLMNDHFELKGLVEQAQRDLADA